MIISQHLEDLRSRRLPLLQKVQHITQPPKVIRMRMRNQHPIQVDTLMVIQKLSQIRNKATVILR